MAAKELLRLSLFAVEWVLSALCLGLFPSSLYRMTKGANQEHVCAIGSTSFCRFGIAWTLLAVLILTVVILWHLEEYCTRFALPSLVELVLVVLLCVMWIIAATSFSLAKTNDDIVDVTSTSRKVLRVVSWTVVALFAASAVTTWRIARTEASALDSAFGSRNESTLYDPELSPSPQYQYDTSYRAYT